MDKDNLLERIKNSGKQRREIEWPGTDHRIHLRVLNENDEIQSTLAVDKIFKDSPLALQNIDKYNSEIETHYLFRTIEDPETGKQLFNDIIDFRESLTPEIKGVLAEELDALHEEFSPQPYKMSSADFKKLVSDIKKNAKGTVGSVTNIFTLRRLIISLVDQRKK